MTSAIEIHTHLLELQTERARASIDRFAMDSARRRLDRLEAVI